MDCINAIYSQYTKTLLCLLCHFDHLFWPNSFKALSEDALRQICCCDETLQGCVVGKRLLNLHNRTLCVTSTCMKMWFTGAWHGLWPPKRWTGLIFSHLRNLWFPLIAPAAQKTAAAVKLWAHSNQQGQLHFYCGTAFGVNAAFR